MNKDTIYIDVEDDITAIIGKVKAAKEKIVAIVPPKRTGVLQSAVNLRLLSRAAKQEGKHLVLISGNSALMALAAAAGIPSARTLQSKPELAPVPQLDSDEGDDIIEGADLPIGELAKTAGDVSGEEPADSPAVDAVIAGNVAEEVPSGSVAGVAALRQPKATAGKSKVKIPNFDTFRKKMVLIVGAALLFVGFFIWAVWFAPHAKIIITARTIESSANPKVTLDPSAATSLNNGTIKAVKQQIKKDASVTFDATGSKEVGEKAKGQVEFYNCESSKAITIPAGTGVSANGQTYITQAAATAPGLDINGGRCAPGKSEPVAIVAQDIGDEFNTNKGTRFTVAGHPNSSGLLYFNATASTDIAGGSKKKITVVSQEDVDKATAQLAEQNNDDVKKQLIERFGKDSVAIDASFNADKGEVVSSPAVDAEAVDGKAKLTGALTFTMVGVSRAEAGKFLDEYFAKDIEDKKDQRVYSNGADKVSFVDVARTKNDAFSATMAATAKFGPKINDAAVKAQSQGKRYGDIQSTLERIPGVEDVDVKFSPFWVSTVPKDDKRISIEFKLNDSK